MKKYKKLLEIFKDLKIEIEKSVQNEVILFFGAELEFYITDKRELKKDDLFIKNLNNTLLKECKEKEIQIDDLEKEDGKNQFEIIFQPIGSAVKLAKDITEVKKIMQKLTSVSFDAKPYEKEPGNAMHIHISLFTKDGINLFDRNPLDKETFFMIFQNAIGGLLELMNESMYIFNDKEECYERLKYPTRDEKYFHYPTNCSWGLNNRTCALRIPSSFSKKYHHSRIEHRVSYSNSDPCFTLIAILYAVFYGIKNKLDCPYPIYGRAFESEEEISQFPRTLKKAKEEFENGRLFAILSDLNIDK